MLAHTRRRTRSQRTRGFIELRSCTLIALLGCIAADCGAQTYDLSGGYSTTENPSGPWHYGWAATLADPFQLFDSNAEGYWHRQGSDYPDVTGPTPVTMATGGGGATNGTEYVIIRWASPQSVLAQYSFVVSGYWDNALVDGDFHIVAGSNVLWSGVLPRRGAGTLTPSGQVVLKAGEPLELRYGVGANGLGDWDRAIVSGAVTVCRADFDIDGFITGLDYDLYVQAFEAGDASADFDGDTFITGLDFDLYVQAFEAGC